MSEFDLFNKIVLTSKNEYYNINTQILYNYLDNQTIWINFFGENVRQHQKYLLFFSFIKHLKDTIKWFKLDFSELIHFINQNSIFCNNLAYIIPLKTKILITEPLINSFYYNLHTFILIKKIHIYNIIQIVKILIDGEFFPRNLIRLYIDIYNEFLSDMKTKYEKKIFYYKIFC